MTVYSLSLSKRGLVVCKGMLASSKSGRGRCHNDKSAKIAKKFREKWCGKTDLIMDLLFLSI